MPPLWTKSINTAPLSTSWMARPLRSAGGQEQRRQIQRGRWRWLLGRCSKYISISRKKVEKGPHSIIGIGKYENVDIDAKNNKEKLAPMPEESLRLSWRQIQ